MRVQIYSSHHLRPEYERNALFAPVWTGGPQDASGRWMTDQDGENVHAQTDLQEMRQQFYIWRNHLGSLDYVGFEHYRRWFLLNPLSGTETQARFPHLFATQRALAGDVMRWRAEIDRTVYAQHLELRRSLTNTQSETLVDWISGFDVIAPRAHKARFMDEQWSVGHPPETWSTFEQVLPTSNYWTGRTPFLDYKQRGSNFCNMYVMRAELFDEYMGLWWEVMGRLAPLIDPNTRERGYLSERLFSLWLLHKRLEQPTLRVGSVPHLVFYDPEFMVRQAALAQS